MPGTIFKIMDGFSYNNIFETKGIEYLIIIAFLVLIIPFWIIINRRASIPVTFKKTLGILSSAMLKVPMGVYYSKNHTWTYMERSGSAKVGLDDLLLHITGDVKVSPVKSKGEFVRKGDLIAEIIQKDKHMRVLSPVTGEILSINSAIEDDPGIVNEDPYGRGWICNIKPSSWIADTNSCYIAEDAVEWSKRELGRLKDFLGEVAFRQSPGTAMLILQDGGELCDKPLSEMPEEIWKEFEKNFLDLAG
jgi:glycine cleavage system H protein